MIYVIIGFLVLFVVVFAFGAFYINKERKEHEQEIEKLKEQEIEKEEIKNSIDLNSHADSVNNMLDLLSKRKK